MTTKPEEDQEFMRWLRRYVLQTGHWVEAFIYSLYDAWLAGKGNPNA